MPAVRLSRYEFAPVQTDENGRTFLDVPEPVKLSVRFDDIRHTVSVGDTLFNLAYRYYLPMLNTNPNEDVRPSGFWWVIAEANGIVDPTDDLKIGTELRIPGLRTLENEILAPPPFLIRDRTV